MPKDPSELTPIFASPAEINDQTDEAMISGIMSTFPVEDNNYRLDVSDVYAAKKEFGHADEKEAILKSKSLTYPIKGTMTLTDKNTGKVLDKVKNFNLSDTYAMTGKHTIVYRGNNYNVSNLILRKPGVYLHSRENGEVESEFNTNSGSGFSIVLDPESLQFNIRAGSTKSVGVPLIPVMIRCFGLTDSDLKRYLPDDVIAANKNQPADRAISSLYSKMVNRMKQNKDASIEEKTVALKEALEASRLDVDTTEITLGASFSHVSQEAILRAMKNLVDTHRGDRGEDNRDSLQFKKVQNLPDFISSHFSKGNLRVTGTVKNMARSLGRVNPANPDTLKIRNLIGAKPFNKVFSSFITESSLSSTPTETNPIESMENVGKATIIGAGYGGIGSAQGVPSEARNVDPSHLGILDPSRTPESDMAGIDLRFTMTSRRDRDGNMYARVKDNNGKIVYLSAKEMGEHTIGFPGDDGDEVHAQVNGNFKKVPRSHVDYWIPAGSDMYTVTTNLVPFLNSDHPGRLTMAGKAIPQTLSLRDREAPLVQTVDSKGRSFSESLARVFTTKSPVDGVVVKVEPKKVTIRGAEGNHEVSLVDNLPFNMKGFHDDEPTHLKVGDSVKAGQTIADNNYTKDGVLALGKNLHIAYMPYEGFNHEDAVVLSRSAAESMISNHAYKFDYSAGDKTVLDLETFRGQFGRKYTPQQLQGLARDGAPAKGRVLHKGDIIWPILEEKEVSEMDMLLGRLHKTLVNKYRDASLIWDHEELGEIVDIDKTGKNIRIIVRSEKSLVEGDKITNFHGGKGIVSLILDDHEMPHSRETGKPVDVLFNPASVTSRINLGQIMETVAAKIAKHDGKPYMVKNYENASNIGTLKKELADRGLSDTEEIYDPKTGKTIGSKVFAGPQYIVKLDKTVDANYFARSTGKYDNVGQPTKGGEEGAKAVGYMEFLGLLGSNARSNLKEMATIKAEGGKLSQQGDYWDKFIRGKPLPKPSTTFATQKFFDYLKGSGIEVSQRDGRLTLAPLTDEKILSMSSGALRNTKMLQGSDARTSKGGLFDIGMTGGIDGTKWSHLPLSESIVSPVLEPTVISILGLKQAEYDNIVSGKYMVKRKGSGNFDILDSDTEKLVRSIHVNAGMTKAASDEAVIGGEAFKQMLDDIDPEAEIAALTRELEVTKAVSTKNNIIKRIKALHGLHKQGFKDLSSAVLLRNIPVIPPVMRPISVNEGRAVVADVNSLYQDLYLVNDGVDKNKDLYDHSFPTLQQARADTYSAAKAIMAAGEPVRFKNKHLKGLMKQIGGDGGPKTGYFQSKLLSRKQDMSGRGTIYAAPDLGFDEVKIPAEQLWTMYDMHIKRDLAQKGYNPAAAKKACEDRNMAAVSSFNKVIKEIPIILNRAPTLMKTNILALKPIPTTGKTIGLNILHLPGYAADYDGDALSMHVPVTPEAIKEANEKLLPSNHLHDARKGFGSPMYAPGHEAILGSVYMTRPSDKKTVVFSSEEEVLAALAAGTISEDTPVQITRAA
jgi:DNA-directed RNA polymerase subunit beta